MVLPKFTSGVWMLQLDGTWARTCTRFGPAPWHSPARCHHSPRMHRTPCLRRRPTAVIANGSLRGTFLPASVSPLGHAGASVGTWLRKSPWWKEKGGISGVLPAGWWCEFCGMGQPQTGSSWGAGLRLQALIHHPDCGGNHTVHFLPVLLLIIPRSVYEKIQFFLLDEGRHMRSGTAACPSLMAERWVIREGGSVLLGLWKSSAFSSHSSPRCFCFVIITYP